MLSILRNTFWLITVVVLLLLVFLPGYSKLQELRGKNGELEAKIKRLAIENALLQQELGRMENDPVYQENVARDKMGVVKKGEIPIKIVPEKKR